MTGSDFGLKIRPSLILSLRYSPWQKIDTLCVYSKVQKCVYNGGRIQYKSNGYDMLRKEYPIFVTYYRPKSWMNTPHFEREMSRLSIVLKKKFPNFDFGY